MIHEALRLTGLSLGEDWSGGVAIVPNVWCHWLDWVIVLCFLFSFLMVVPSYLLVHSICTKKLD